MNLLRRKPAGTPTGGQFATQHRSEAGVHLQPTDPTDHGVPEARAAEIAYGSAQARYALATRRTGLRTGLRSASTELQKAEARFMETRSLLARRGDHAWDQAEGARCAAFAEAFGELPSFDVAIAALDAAAAEERRWQREVATYTFVDFDDPLDRVFELERARDAKQAATLVCDVVRRLS